MRCVRWTRSRSPCWAARRGRRPTGGWCPPPCPWCNGSLDIMEKFVCAFRGRRDAYQVPLALAEGDLLETFITDVYATPPARAIGSLLPVSSRSRLELR